MYHERAVKLKSIFRENDSDGSGIISWDKLTAVLKSLDPTFTEEELKVLLDSASDLNKAGMLQYANFIDFLYAFCPPAVPPKPESTTLYCKAGPEGQLGDCPFTHSVQMALTLKGVKYEVVPCTQDTKPKWLLDEVGGKMPCVVHEGTPHVETSEILAWIDSTFLQPSLAAPTDVTDMIKTFGLFPSIAGFTKNTDVSKDTELRQKLQTALCSLGSYLADRDFAAGQQPTLVDCDLLPKLYVISHATAHFKDFKLQDFEGKGIDAVSKYYDRGSRLPAFQVGAYPPAVGCWGWGGARGLDADECMEEYRKMVPGQIEADLLFAPEPELAEISGEIDMGLLFAPEPEVADVSGQIDMGLLFAPEPDITDISGQLDASLVMAPEEDD